MDSLEPVMQGRLGEVITQLHELQDPPLELMYFIYALYDADALHADVACIVTLESAYGEDDPIGIRHGWGVVCEGRLAQDVVRVAREDKPDATAEELIQALEYYLDHDAYIDFGSLHDNP